MWTQLIKNIARLSDQKGTLPEATPEFLQEIWPTLVGEHIARLSTPLRLDDKDLHILVRHPHLVEEWRRQPLPLLRRIRQYSPWPVERLQISHDPGAGQIGNPKGDPKGAKTSKEDPRRDIAVESPTAAGIDAELQELIDSISRHRKKREADS